MSAAASPVAAGSRLADRLIAVSVSHADDLPQMGHSPDQLLRVLQAVLVPLVAEGARIAYGGRIKVTGDNYTLSISNQLAEAYRRLDRTPGNRPFVHFIAQHRLAGTSIQDLCDHLRQIAPYGEVWVTGRDGVTATLAAATPSSARIAACAGCGLRANIYIQEGDGPRWLETLPMYHDLVSTDVPEASESFTAMRRQMAANCDARVQVGGRKTDFSGPISGLCEEALLTIAAAKPLYILGGFGGASRDIAIELGLLDEACRVPRLPQADEARYATGLKQLRSVRAGFDALFSPQQHRMLRSLAATESVLDASEMLLTHLAAR